MRAKTVPSAYVPGETSVASKDAIHSSSERAKEKNEKETQTHAQRAQEEATKERRQRSRFLQVVQVLLGYLDVFARFHDDFSRFGSFLHDDESAMKVGPASKCEGETETGANGASEPGVSEQGRRNELSGSDQTRIY